MDVESHNIIDVCNPRLANDGLAISKKAGLVLTCKMAVYVDEGKTYISLYLTTKQLPRDIEAYKELSVMAEEAEALSEDRKPYA